MKKFLYLFIIFSIFSFNNALCYEWLACDGPNGASVNAILFINDSLIIAATSNDTPQLPSYGIYRSSDAGITWEHISNGIPGDIAATCLFMTNSGAILCGIDGTGLFKSTDEGLSWTNVGTNLPYINYIAETSGGIIFTQGSIRPYLSSDDGETWIKLDDYCSQSLGSGWGVAVDSHDNMYMLPKTAVVKSTDGGLSWQVMDNGLTDKTCRALFVDSEDNIWVATWTAGVFRSTDSGDSWEKISSGLESIKSSPKGKCFSENAVNHTIYLGTPYDGLYALRNSETSWAQINNPGYYDAVTSISLNSKGYIYYGNRYVDMCVSTDEGETWQLSNLRAGKKAIYELYSRNNIIYAGTGDGVVYKSYNSGKTWSVILAPPKAPMPFIMSLAVTPKGTILTTRSQSGMYRSTNGGASWESLWGTFSILPETYLFNDTTIYAGCRSTGVSVSSDEGKTWFTEQGVIAGNDIYSLAKDSNEVIFAGSGRKGLYKKNKTDGVWSKTPFPDGIFINALAVNSKNELFIGVYENAVYKSVDEGETFQKCDFDKQTETLCISDDDRIFAGTSTNCFVSEDDGLTWTNITDGFDGYYVRAMAYDDRGGVFAGTITNGLYVLDLYGNSVDSKDLYHSEKPIQIFPNPASDYIDVFYKNSDNKVKIQIITLTGIIALESDMKDRIDISSLARGIYLVKIGCEIVKFVKM